MRKARLIVTRKLPKIVEENLIADFDVSFNACDTPMSKTLLHQAFQSADAILPTVSDPIDKDVIGANPRAKIIANFGVGYNNIDINAAKTKGITVTNTPDVLTEATADIAFLLILASTRKMKLHRQKIENKSWEGFKLSENLGMGLQGKTLGIIGMGRIGQATARRARVFGMDVIYYNRSARSLDFEATMIPSICDVLTNSDVVSLHIPGGQGGPIITEEMIKHLRPHTHLINTARGDVVDERALIHALQEGLIAGVGLDVFHNEPNVPQALIDHPNAVLLPHIGSATEETRTAMGMLCVDNLIDYFAGKTPRNRVA